MAGMTIDEVKKEKVKLELAVLKLLQDFESSTQTFTGYIDISRKRTKREDEVSDDGKYPTYEEPKGMIENVEISMRIEM